MAPILAPTFPSTHLAQEEVVPAPPEEHFYDNFFQRLPPAPQDNEIDQELDRPILPMPEGYVPPPLAPLTLDPMSSPNAFLNLDSNLESFDDTLKAMQSQNTTMGLVCSPPHLHYQFDNFVRFSLPSTTSVSTPSTSTTLVGTTSVTTPRTTSVGTPQTTSVMLVITPHTMSVSTPNTTSVGTTPVITPRTTSVDMPTITHQPVVRSSTTPAITPSPAAPTTTIPITTSSVAAPTTPVTLGLDAQNPSNVVDERPAKHQKQAQCTRAGDPLQAVSSGRGKRQRFQSTRAAAANAIG